MRNILLKLAAAALALTMLMSVTGCKSGNSPESNPAAEQTALEKVQKALLNMQTYQSEGTVEYISNKNRNKYDIVQQCRMSGEYRIEVTGPAQVAGNVTTFDGKVICQTNPKISGKIYVGTTESLERGELFLHNFMKNYFSSHEVTIAVSSIGNSPHTVLEAVIPGNHPYIRSEKLFVDNRTLKPSKLVLYDSSGNERIILTYESFEYNVPLDDSIFAAN